MIVILVVALVLAVFRLGSWAGLGAIVPFGFTAMLARIGSGPGRADYRPTLLIAAAGTLVIPFLVAIAINRATWGYFLERPGLDLGWPPYFVILAYLLFFPTILVQAIVAFVVWRGRRQRARAADAAGGSARSQADPSSAG